MEAYHKRLEIVSSRDDIHVQIRLHMLIDIQNHIFIEVCSIPHLKRHVNLQYNNKEGSETQNLRSSIQKLEEKAARSMALLN
jgi:hypothetical protein